MKEQFIEQCLLVLARDDVKKEVKEFFSTNIYNNSKYQTL